MSAAASERSCVLPRRKIKQVLFMDSVVGPGEPDGRNRQLRRRPQAAPRLHEHEERELVLLLYGWSIRDAANWCSRANSSRRSESLRTAD